MSRHSNNRTDNRDRQIEQVKGNIVKYMQDSHNNLGEQITA